jgi:outer membrane receptor protein involved in Fe transport
LSTWQTGNNQGYQFGLAADGNGYAGAQESATGNPFLTWEKSKKTNIGVDIELFNGQLAFTGDVFKENRTQILTTATIIPDVTGVQNLPAINAGIVDNKGFEGELTMRKRLGNHNIMIRGSY